MSDLSVLHVISSIDPAYGGPVQALLGLTTAQAALGLDVRVISATRSGEDGSCESLMTDAGIGVTTVGPCRGALRRHPELRSAIEASIERADIVHIHAIWEQIQHEAGRTCRRCSKPYIIRPCGMLDPWCLAQGWLKKRLYIELRLRRNINHAAAVHFTSEIERDLVQPLGFKAPVIVEPNGVQLEEFAELPEYGSFRQHYPQLDAHPLLIFMSRVHPKKGLDVLIPAFARLKDTNVRLAIVGPADESYRREVDAMIARHDVRDRVILTGMLKGVERIKALRDADLFVLPSRQENFGVAVVESLAAGTPVVISDQVNIYREIVKEGVGDAVPREVSSFAEAIERWLADPKRRKTASERARSFVRDRYDWAKIAQRWYEHYERLRS